MIEASRLVPENLPAFSCETLCGIKMRVVALLSVLSIILSGCGPRDKDDVLLDIENCNFSFQIIEESAHSYRYNSETGRLSKLIDPFEGDGIYADTTFLIPKENICELMKLFVLYEINNYPQEFQPESDIIMTPEPSYQIKFTANNQSTAINWTTNTELFESEDALKLRKIISKIDSIILTSSEFRHLPEHEYEWL